MRTSVKLLMEQFPLENADLFKSRHFGEKLDALILMQTRGNTASKLASCFPRHCPCLWRFKGRAFWLSQLGSPSEEVSQSCSTLSELSLLDL